MRLSGKPGEVVALAKSLPVMPGDSIDMVVFAKYIFPTEDNANVSSLLFPALAASLGLSSAIAGEMLQAFQSLSELFSTGALITSSDWQDDEPPRAYLNYILFDKNFVAYDMGFNQIDRSKWCYGQCI